MFHEESRVQTQKGKTKGEETPISVMVRLEKDRGERGLMAAHMCKYKRGKKRRLRMESLKRRTILHIALLNDKNLQWPQKWNDEDRL